MKNSLASLCLSLSLVPFIPTCLYSQSETPKRHFKAEDDVALRTIVDGYDRGDLATFSPDGHYVSIVTEEGLLAQNAPEDTIWIFDTQEIQNFLHRSGQVAPAPLALVRMAAYKDGPIIQHVRWLDDSSGVVFLALNTTQRSKFHQLFRADMKTRMVTPMTPDDQDVRAFDVRGMNYVYEVKAPDVLGPVARDAMQEPVVLPNVATLLIPPPSQMSPFTDVGLWAVVGGRKFQVLESGTQKPIQGTSGLSLSPSGKSLIAVLNVASVPQSWHKYKEPLIPGRQDYPLDSGAYHLIDLTTGHKTLLVDAPTGRNQAFWNTPEHWFAARWSQDERSVLLSNTFLPLDASSIEENQVRETQPCTAVLRLTTRGLTCVLPIKSRIDKGRYSINDIRFEDDRTVVIDFDRSYFLRDQPTSAIFHQNSEGSWKLIAGVVDPISSAREALVKVVQDVNHPPVLLAEDKVTHNSGLIWDPNPQLQNIDLGEANVLSWKDDSGYEWEAGLVKPPDFTPSRAYPLVIQTHGFNKTRFLSNGSFTTAFAARALAATGMMVLQMPENYLPQVTPREGLAQIEGFESAVKTLVAKGLVDPTRVGIIGFSRTVYHVLEALTKSKLRFAAASVSDGITMSYFQYVFVLGYSPVAEEEQIYGSAPFTKAGLSSWVVNSPGFNMYKVQTPLLFLQPGEAAVLSDWEPYAALRSLNKPVDLIMLPSGTHVMTNPRQRLESETINVDWFRFWLKNEEDPDPAKREQYTRWRGLRKLQEQTPGMVAPQVSN